MAIHPARVSRIPAHVKRITVQRGVLVAIMLGLACRSLPAQELRDLMVKEVPPAQGFAGQYQESPRMVRRGIASAQGRPLPEAAHRSIAKLQFDSLPLAEAMQSLSKEVGLNIVTSELAGAKPITVYLENVTAIDAVEAVVKANGLFYRIDEGSGIVRIATKEEYVSDLSSFREEETRVFTLLYPNPDAVARAIGQVYGDRVQLASADDGFSDLIELTQRFNRFDLVDGRALGLGTFGGAPAGLGGAGGGIGGFGGGFGGLGGGLGGFGGGLGGLGGLTNRSRSRVDVPADALRQRAEERQLVEDMIQDLENARAGSDELSEQQQAELQRRSEATIFISTIRRNNQVVVRTGDPRTMEQIAQLVAQLDVPTPTVLLEVKVLRVELADGFNSAFEYFAGDRGEAVAFSDGPQLGVPPVNGFLGGIGTARQLAGGLGVAGSVPGALNFQVIDDNFRFRMQLLQSKNRVTALATPLILTANNEVSRIFVGDTLPFTVGFTPGQVVGGIQNTVSVPPTPVTELRDVGQSLLITPNINSDRTVTLRIVEENSERVINGASIPLPQIDGAAPQLASVDTVRRRSVSGTVVAADGMAVALGGLIEEQVVDTRDQVPILGDIPKIGFLFRRQVTGRQRSELIVMIRPYVFNTPAEAAQRSQCAVSQHSLHPSGPDPQGTLNTYLPCEVIRPDPECAQRRCLLRMHNVVPTVY